MATAQDKYAAASSAALCNMLGAVGSTAASYAAWSLLATGPFSWGALGITGIAGLAYSYGCPLDTDAGSSLPPGYVDGCQSIVGGYGYLMVDLGSGPVWIGPGAPDSALVTSITGVTVTCSSSCLMQVTYETVNGTRNFTEVRPDLADFENWKWSLDPITGSCDSTLPPDPPSPVPPYVYTDPDDGCQLTVTFEGFVVGAGGETGAGWKIEPTTQQYAGGGIIGGCNFSPVIYYQPPGGGGGGSGGGGGFDIPWNPGPEGPQNEPWWVDLVRSALGGVAGALVKTLIDELLVEQVGGKVYRLTSVCETNAAGEPVDLVREVDIPSVSILQAAIYRLDAIEYLLQGLKDFKQPTCRKLNYQGQLVSVDFKSDEVSPNGDKALRKLFRYRDQTDTPLPDHVAHWESFVWQAGPAIVIHKGAVWGVLKVWAADAEEGKRVIRHAGAIAGVNPDAEGEWEITSSSDPRYGQPGTMRIATRKSWGGQILQISKRPGPDGLPIVPCDCG